VYHAGEWLLPLLAFWLQDWRLLNLAIAAICCITGALLLPIPESPRWLLLKGRQQEARRALSWLAQLNGRQLPEGLVITHAVELTPAAADNVELGEREGLVVAAGDALPDHAGCGQIYGSSSSSLQEEGSGGTAAPLAARPLISKGDVNSDSELPNDDCTALLADRAPVEAKPEQQQENQRAGVQQSASMLALFSHALLARYFVVASLLCTVMAICFYTINLATDSLQVCVRCCFYNVWYAGFC
jgi:Flp pilus assembly protein TadB